MCRVYVSMTSYYVYWCVCVCVCPLQAAAVFIYYNRHSTLWYMCIRSCVQLPLMQYGNIVVVAVIACIFLYVCVYGSVL